MGRNARPAPPPIVLRFTGHFVTPWGSFTNGQRVPCWNLEAARHLVAEGWAKVVATDGSEAADRIADPYLDPVPYRSL